MSSLWVNPLSWAAEFPKELGTRMVATRMGGFPRPNFVVVSHTNNVIRHSSSLTSLMSLGLCQENKNHKSAATRNIDDLGSYDLQNGTL